MGEYQVQFQNKIPKQGKKIKDKRKSAVFKIFHRKCRIGQSDRTTRTVLPSNCIVLITFFLDSFMVPLSQHT